MLHGCAVSPSTLNFHQHVSSVFATIEQSVESGLLSGLSNAWESRGGLAASW